MTPPSVLVPSGNEGRSGRRACAPRFHSGRTTFRPAGIKFAGYAALFDRVDRGGDVVRAGAFGTPRRVPVLLEHDRRRVVGWADVAEDARGLRAVGRVGVPVATGAGLSFGYRVRRARVAAGVRELEAVELIEVSLVSEPMQARARVLAVEEGRG